MVPIGTPNTTNSIKVPHLPQENVVLFWGQPFLIVLGSRAVQSFWWQRILEFEAHIMRWKSHETLKPHWNWTSSKISKTCKEGWSVHMARVYNPCEYQLASLIHVGMPCDHRYVGVVSGFHLNAAMSLFGNDPNKSDCPKMRVATCCSIVFLHQTPVPTAQTHQMTNKELNEASAPKGSRGQDVYQRRPGSESAVSSLKFGPGAIFPATPETQNPKMPFFNGHSRILN